jgi:hypothetical protein
MGRYLSSASVLLESPLFPWPSVGAERRRYCRATQTGSADGSRPTAAKRARVSASLCVGHVRQFGGESPLCNLMEVKH